MEITNEEISELIEESFLPEEKKPFILGEFQKMPDEEYFAADAMNASSLKEILVSPAHYKSKILDGEQKAPTEAMKFGTLFHMAILEPNKLKEKVIIEPKFDKRTTKGKNGYKEWLDSLNGNEIFATQKDIETLTGMINSTLNYPVVANILKDITSEIAGFWHDEEFDIDCKCKIDAITSSEFIVELKSTKSSKLTMFEKQMMDLRYDLSAAWYWRGYKAITGKDPKGFIFIAVEKEPPYACCVHVADLSIIEVGENGNEDSWGTVAEWNKLEGYRHAIQKLKKAQETNIWPAYQTKSENITIPSKYL